MSERSVRRPRVVAANWKMNLGPRAAEAFLEGFRPRAAPGGVDILLFPSAISFAAAVEGARTLEVPVGLGIQNIHAEPAGAFTGEVSAEMAAEAGATHVLVGHSERRRVFGEKPDDTARKTSAAFRAGLIPLLCVGETLPERNAGRLEDVLGRQLEVVLSPRSLRERVEGGAPFLLAYEPVWAIGTGETATPDDAAAAHGFLRRRLETHVGERAASIPILYGGSVSAANARELLSASDVDGVLVGGASLDPTSFGAIVEAASGAGAPGAG